MPPTALSIGTFFADPGVSSKTGQYEPKWDGFRCLAFKAGIMFAKVWRLIKETVLAYIADGALSRGAAIAYFAVTSIAPVLVIAIAIAGLAVGEDAARGRITDQLGGLLGHDSAKMLQTVLSSASTKSSGIAATGLGLLLLLVTASGVFGEIQSALNAIWKAEPKGGTVSRLVRARMASLGLVAALGFLLLISLVVSAALAALGDYLDTLLPFGKIILTTLNFALSFALISVLFAAVYKILPDKDLKWPDVWIGAVATALLFTIGKFLIALYIARSATASSYGAAGALVVLLLWIYYTTQIFLLGAEFTKVYASRRGSQVPQNSQAISAAARTSKAAASIHQRDDPPPPPAPARTKFGVWDFVAFVFLIGAILNRSQTNRVCRRRSGLYRQPDRRS
jgi:membrane protein